MDAPASLVASIKDSLGNAAHGWFVTGYATHTTTSGSSEDAVTTITYIVSLSSAHGRMRTGVGNRAPLTVSYVGGDDGGTLHLDGIAFPVVDAALHTQILAMAEARAAVVAADVLASLAKGPQAAGSAA